MARVSQQSSGAITVWMIVFAALWLTSTVFLIILYTGQEDLISHNKTLTQAKLQLISTSEQRSIPLIQNLSGSGKTAVGILEGARRETALLATGDEADDPSTVRAKRDKFFDEINREQLLPEGTRVANLSLLEAANLLSAALSGNIGRMEELSDRVAKLDTEVRTLEESLDSERLGFEEKAKKLESRFAESEASRVAYQKARDEAISAIEDDIEKTREEGTRQITSEREKNQALERDLGALRGRLAAQEQKSGGLTRGPDTLAPARLADGSVLTAVAGDDVVYIDLGEKDRLNLGMQFAVYSGENGIPADGRAKAQIEVASIFEDSAECKIVRRRRGQVVFEGDLIANPVYDRDRPQKFLVVGEFDLDRDGQVDAAGAQVIESLVREWGGVVTQELSAVTDFMVLGASPKRPLSGSTRNLSAEQAERRAAREKAWSLYADRLSTARALSVPILSHDLFLNFLGYR